ncbi:MAG: type I-U CRISPR-associated RAMP protein Csb1/Cas7u [Pseudomonadota bacterium]
MSEKMSLQTIRDAMASSAAAFRCITEYQPAGGPGDKVFPPTYEGGKYAVETRVLEGGEVAECVLLDSVQSQANRMEMALLEAHRAKLTALPLVVARFDDGKLLKKFSVTSLEAPHRIADAIFRDSLYNGVMFRKSDKGRILDSADIRNATGLFGLCPTALLFGLWDSTGPRGGLGAKFQRAIVSEMVGICANAGIAAAGKSDPLPILTKAYTLHRRSEPGNTAPDWTLAEKGEDGEALPKIGKEGKPSEVNLGGVTPDYSYVRDQRTKAIIYDTVIGDDGKERRVPRIKGGFTISKARQTTIISLTALRRLRFPLNDAADSDPRVDVAARTVLAALGLAAAALTRDESADLRSRCHLIATSVPEWDLIDKPGQTPKRFQLTGDQALGLLGEAIEAAKKAGLPWEGEIALTPHEDLVELVRRSQELAAAVAGDE